MKQRKHFYLFKDTVTKIKRLCNHFKKENRYTNFSVVVTQAVDLLYKEIIGE